MKDFHFKQFKIIQENSAMKVGTDAVLLGAWADISNATKILDIGSGTGLISLMLAQRNSLSKITAIEIDEKAYKESLENFKNSIWANRIKAICSDISDFKTHDKYDFIVSNPPFYNNTFQADNKQRNKARQSESLSFKTLLSKTTSLLSKEGKASFIIPFFEEENFVTIAKANKLFLNRKLHIKGNVNTGFKRSLLEFSFKKKEVISGVISIEISRHNYTKEYKELVKDFYIKM